MRNWKGSRAAAAATLALALFTLGAAREAGAHPRGHIGFYGGFYGGFYPWGFGYGWGPYWGWGPYPYPAGGVDMNYAMISGMGAVDLNVKPNRADVWVDGRYVSEARDLDGDPTYLWLPDGAHRLQVYKGGFKVFDEQIDVRRGMKSEIKIKLEPGEGMPPGMKPGDKALETAKPQSEKPKDEKPKADKPKDETDGSD